MNLEERILEVFDDIKFQDQGHQEYFSYSGFSNLGYWPEPRLSGEQAARCLVDKLVSFVPEKAGRVLDVACGQGGTTRRLAEHFGASNVVGVNLSERQIAEAQKLVPDCTFKKMDAAQLEFDDESFDIVVCVEAAFHFETRERFLQQALRVLKPGGRLVLSDIIFARLRPPTVPKVNAISTREEYRALFDKLGFVNVSVEDAFDHTVRPAAKAVMRFAWSLVRRDGVAQANRFIRTATEVAWWRFLFREYLLVQAEKPLGPAGARP